MKKNIFMRILAIALVTMSIMAVAIPAMAVSSCTTNTTGVYIRKTANKSAQTVCKVTQGTSVAVLCKAEGTNINTSSSTVWYYVKIKSGANKGKIGYVHSSLVDGFKESELDRPNSRAEALGSDGTLIKSGAKGSEVRNIQYVLYLEDYLKSKKDIDGAFGSKTKAALEKYQEDHFGHGAEWEADPVDGIVGNQTRNEMWKDHETSIKSYGYLY